MASVMELSRVAHGPFEHQPVVGGRDARLEHRGRLAGNLEVWDSSEPFLDEDAQLHARDTRANAFVRTLAECARSGEAAFEIDLEGIGKGRFIEVHHRGNCNDLIIRGNRRRSHLSRLDA